MESSEQPAENSPNWWRPFCLAAGPVFAAVAFAATGDVLPDPARKVLFVTVWTAIWWATEPIPIPATSLLPAILFPLLRICEAKTAAQYYAHPLILLLLGGFFIARAVEIWGLHKRIALTVISWLGESPRQLVFGFVASAALLSMWISNTATTLMLLPIALSVVHRLRQTLQPAEVQRFTTCLLLGIAYGANVGGTGTLIGTPPNLIFADKLSVWPSGAPVDFLSWMKFGVPLVVLFVPLIALLLTRVLIPVPSIKSSAGRDVIRQERAALGPLDRAEWRVLIVFCITAALWIFRGNAQMFGWSQILIALDWFSPEELHKYVGDWMVALVMALVLFVVPSGERERRPLLVWDDVQEVPWGMLFLFGGGFAIAGGFKTSGLSQWLGDEMGSVAAMAPDALIPLVALMVTFLTELTSNTASTAMLMPILHSAAEGAGRAPFLVMLPAIMAVSFAFMLPVATAPNAIVFGTGRIPILTMIRTGFVFNLVGVLVIWFVVRVIALPWFGV
ncbi:MAG: DASS family sodium-coupled anion symporter [Planctomycetota bacterium]